MKKLLSILVFVYLFSMNAYAETYLTPWNFQITTSSKVIYAGHVNIDEVKDKLIKQNIVKKNILNKFIKNLNDKKIIYIFSEEGGRNIINANTQNAPSMPSFKDSEVLKTCSDLKKSYIKMTKLKLVQTDCILEFFNNKVNSKKFSENLSKNIKSILFYGHEAQEYNRSQLQYFVNYDKSVTIFTLGCTIGDCEVMHDEMINVINSIKFN